MYFIDVHVYGVSRPSLLIKSIDYDTKQAVNTVRLTGNLMNECK